MRPVRVMLLLVLAACLLAEVAEGGKKKVVIHVPVQVKKHKHTHTVYKIIHHHDHHGGHHGGHKHG